jgi:hypothetical protein
MGGSMSAKIVDLMARRRDSQKFADFDESPVGCSIPVWIAEARLVDTPDETKRAEWARSILNTALRDLRLRKSRRHRETDAEWLQWKHDRAQGQLAIAFVMLGHLLGIRHPEALFADRKPITDRQIATIREAAEAWEPMRKRWSEQPPPVE